MSSRELRLPVIVHPVWVIRGEPGVHHGVPAGQEDLLEMLQRQCGRDDPRRRDCRKQDPPGRTHEHAARKAGRGPDPAGIVAPSQSRSWDGHRVRGGSEDVSGDGPSMSRMPRRSPTRYLDRRHAAAPGELESDRGRASACDSLGVRGIRGGQSGCASSAAVHRLARRSIAPPPSRGTAPVQRRIVAFR
jgi:hypothetical protein